jgi:C4-type Zn-finger protein
MGWPRPPGERHNHVRTKRFQRPIECPSCKETLEFYDLQDKKPSFARRLFTAIPLIGKLFRTAAEPAKTCPYCGSSVDALLSREH